jgi:AcrR family transcriptional regulator
MSPAVNPRRSYDSSRRQAQARQTRSAVLESARTELLAKGYAGTTIAAVARGAGVSVETVYKAFGNKAGLLKATFDVAIVGDDEPVPLMERPEIKANIAEPDPRKKLHHYASFFIERAVRSVPLQLLARDAAASDPAAAEVWDAMLQERLTGMTRFAQHLHDDGHLRAGITADDARDILWAYNAAEMWELLVIRRGWTPERFGTWIAEQLIAALL